MIHVAETYANTSFNICTNEAKTKKEFKENKKANNHTIITNTKDNTEISLFKETEDESDVNDELIRSRDQIVVERKQLLLSKSLKEKTNSYFLYLSVLLLCIGILKTIDVLIFNKIYDGVYLHAEILAVLISRLDLAMTSVSLLREELHLNSIISLNEGNFVV